MFKISDMASGKLQLLKMIRKKVGHISWNETVQILVEIRKRNGGKLIGLKLSKFFSLISEIQAERNSGLAGTRSFKLITCPICFKNFSTKSSRDVHKKIIHLKTMKTKKVQSSCFPCAHCGKIYSHQVSLKRHTLQVHDTNKKNFDCDDCNKSFNRKDNLWRHREMVHNLVNINIGLLNTKLGNKCNMCKAIFKNKDILMAHLSLNACFNMLSDEGKFQCDLCQKSYVYKFDLKRHIRMKHSC